MPIIGSCPYCNESHMINLPDEMNESIEVQLPIFQKAESDCCNRIIWIYYSRINPEVYTEEEFNEKYRVDEDKKEIIEII